MPLELNVATVSARIYPTYYLASKLLEVLSYNGASPALARKSV